MSKLTKRVLSLIAVVTMLVGLLPTNLVARAEEGELTYTFDATKLESCVDKTAYSSLVVDNFFTLNEGVIRADSKNVVYAVEPTKGSVGKITFTVPTGYTATAVVAAASTGKTNNSKFALIDAQDNQLSNEEGLTEVVGTAYTDATYKDLTAGTYSVVGNDTGCNTRFQKVVVTLSKIVEEPTPEESAPEESAPAETPASAETVYNFHDGSFIPVDTQGNTDVTSGDLTIKVGNKNAYQYHSAEHGIVFKEGNSFELKVKGAVKVSFAYCSHNGVNSLTMKAATGSYEETQLLEAGCHHDNNEALTFTYTSAAETTLVLEFPERVYIKTMTVTPIEATEEEETTPADQPTFEGSGDETERVIMSFETASPVPTEFTAGGLVLKLNNSGNKMAIDGNDAGFGTAESFTMYSVRLKTGGKSGSANGMTLTVPSAGTLYIAVRTGSSADRAIVLSQDGTEIYRSTLKDTEYEQISDTAKVYAYREVEIEKAGDVVITYPDGSINFYAFEFEAAPTETPDPDQGEESGEGEKIEAVEATADFMKDDALVALIQGGQHEFTYKNVFTFKMGADNAWSYNGNQHGTQFKEGNIVEIKVAGPTMIEIGDCQYSNSTEITMKSVDGKYTETKSTKTGCYHYNKSELVFDYEGSATTLIIEFTGTVYVPVIKITPLGDYEPTNGSQFGGTEYYDFQTEKPFDFLLENKLNGTHTFSDGLVAITSAGSAYWENKTTGIRLGLNDTITIKVPGDSYISFLLPADSSKAEGKWEASCTYPLGKIECLSDSNAVISSGIAGLSCVFKYTGREDTLTFKVTDITTEKGLAAILGIIVSNQLKDDSQKVGNGNVDAFDFGAEELDTNKYNNYLDVNTINGFYPGVTVDPAKDAPTGIALPTFKTKDILFSAGGNSNNRLRTKNPKLIKYDAKDLTVKDADGNVVTAYNGYVYSNSSANASVFLGILLYPGDKLTIMASSNGGDSTVVCEAPDGSTQSYTTKGNAATEMVFYASEYGIYRLYSTNEKLVVARMERQHFDPVTVTGTVAGETLPAGDYTIVYKNDLSGAETVVKPVDNKYTVVLHKDYTYTVSIHGANGYIVSADSSSYTAAASKKETVNVEKIVTVTVSGKISGLPDISKLTLKFVNTEKSYVPEITINADGTYTANVQQDVLYTVVAEGVNDFEITSGATVKASADATQNFAFAAKKTYKVNVTTEGIKAATWANAVLTFTNLNEEGYVYSFKATEAIMLRDGQYSVRVNGVGNEVVQKLTANAIVNGAESSLKIKFEQVTSWNPGKLNKEFGGAGIETIGDSKYYAGLILAGDIVENKTYLLAKGDKAQIMVPVKKGQMLTLSYCYEAAFVITDYDVLVDELTKSTSQIDRITLIAKEDGYITISGIKGSNGAQTYVTGIEVSDVILYQPEITVGEDKQFKTINEALKYVAAMERLPEQRVTIVIDPGNYEEMLVVNLPNITLKNAAGNRASTNLTNKGVDIDKNAVRITSYYLHGYYYYSMGSDCKYDAELLEVNKANGTYSFKNPGSGTTAGSYWNATVVILANGFEADGIIFENSANQYISLKESQDIVVAGTGNKGVRPTAYGDTTVQNKSFVERAAALAIGNNYKEIKFTNCRFVGRQDTLYGGTGVTAAFDRCQVMGACDFIFGGMTAVFNRCDLVMNTSDASSDVAYITAAQQTAGRGYLMYECHITSTTPGVDTASKYASKPGYFGRPWQANTAEVVFYNTLIDASDDYYGQDSLIHPTGWLSTLSGESDNVYEFGTKEEAFYDNEKYRVGWSHVLKEAVLKDGTDISTEEKAIEAFLGSWKAFN